jgi:hypothetical protein
MRAGAPLQAGPEFPRRWPRLATLLAPLLVAGCVVAGCVCPPRAEQLLATGFATPRQTFESFQTFLAADLPDQEFHCFSAGFRDRNGLSLLAYGEGRDAFLADHPLMRWMAKAEIVRQEAVAEGVHVIEARVAGRTFHVKMVREDSFEISSGEELLADGPCVWDEVVDQATRPRSRLRATVTPDPQWTYGDLADATRVVVERSWRIDDLWEDAVQAPNP